MRVVSFRRAAWSDDGKTVTLGIAKWEDKPPPAPGAGRGGRAGGDGANAAATAGGAEGEGRGARGAAPNPEPPSPENEMADVTVWHWKDARVASVQRVSANADRRRNLLGVWHLGSGGFTKIGRDFDETIQVIPRTNWALVQEWGRYAMQRSIGRSAADLVLADLTTGARTPLKAGVGGNVQMSPGGKYAAVPRERRVVDAESRDEGGHEHLEGRPRRRSSTRNRTRRSNRSRRSVSPAGRSRTRP